MMRVKHVIGQLHAVTGDDETNSESAVYIEDENGVKRALVAVETGVDSDDNPVIVLK